MNALPTKFNNKFELIKQFVLYPIIESQEFVKDQINSMNHVSENKISNSIVRYLKYKSKFKDHYGTHLIEAIPKFTQVSQTGINEPDLKFIIYNTKNQITFEAKRINQSNPPSVYCGKDGFKRFTSNYYEINDYCGMLGYMETGKLNNRIAIIKATLLDGKVNKIKDVFNNLFLSFHKSKKKRIKSFHLILDLT